MAKKDTVKIRVEITEALDEGDTSIWLAGTFEVKVPKSVAKEIPAPESFSKVITVEPSLSGKATVVEAKK